MIVSSNIGCQNHLASGAQVPVKHWIVALEERVSGRGPGKSGTFIRATQGVDWHGKMIACQK